MVEILQNFVAFSEYMNFNLSVLFSRCQLRIAWKSAKKVLKNYAKH